MGRRPVGVGVFYKQFVEFFPVGMPLNMKKKKKEGKIKIKERKGEREK